MRAAQSTVRLIGPGTLMSPTPTDGSTGTRPKVGLMPNTPEKAPGMRIEPPPSPETAIGAMPVATDTAAPPEEPPAALAGFHGLRVMPDSGLSVTPFQPNSGVVVLPKNTEPFSRSRATMGES